MSLYISYYLIGKGYKNDELCPCIIIKKMSFRFAIIAIFVDDRNIIGTLAEIREPSSYLKYELR